MDKPEPIRVIAMLKREMKKRNLCVADVARSMNTSHSTVFGSLQRPTIQVQKLLEWCELLQYNFFKEIAVKLPYNDPPDADNSPVVQQQKRIQELEMEVVILKRTLKELVAPKS
ncbi:MAG TPA: hypothetical protein DD458_08345 [Prolixibacteraceae bacterium]|nr:hypothetical protein [Prolixibacteraceae bacterium]HCU59684.1 hypothetical protein [Prolixibacteraceae bacterium]